MKLKIIPLHLVHNNNDGYGNDNDMVNMESKSKWQCPKCGVGLPYNPTYKIEGLCPTCRTYEDSDRLLGGYRLKKTRTQ
ncbi:MAG TPA: hypothetical protein VFR94_17050 [Nitrososphaeraceae archaeon]|jgi:hypothetical protein|nr:hypothetical protein [Nitrososphaeraceae archaeon]